MFFLVIQVVFGLFKLIGSIPIKNFLFLKNMLGMPKYSFNVFFLNDLAHSRKQLNDLVDVYT